MLSPRRIRTAFWPPLAVGGGLVVVAIAAAILGKMPRSVTIIANPAESRPIKLLISGDTHGWIVPCGCTANQSGGLLRRGTFVGQERERSEIVFLDAGGAAAGTSPYDRARFEAILDGERLMRIAAHNLGASELALGPRYLREVAARKNVPFISANAADAAGRRVAEPYRLLAAGGRRLLAVGVLSPQFATADCQISEPQQAVLKVVDALQGQFDALVVLAWLPEGELRDLAAALPEADAVVGGPTGQSIAPQRVGATLLASATNKGKFVVTLEVPEQATVEWRGSVIELSADYADDRAQRDNLQRFRVALAERDFAAADSGLPNPVANLSAANDRVSGTAACRDCHAAEFTAWQSSAHAHAWQPLVAAGAQVDSQCQQCHTTGFGWQGGFVSVRRSEDATSVGCESCHGPSAAHARDAAVRTPLAPRESCRGCHDLENSPQFDFAKYWPAIAHGKKEK
jgi:hypothetical protein